jgi:hypothetical protein
MAGEQQRELLVHEIVHTVQQGSRPVPLDGRVPVSSPCDPAEIEAAHIAATETKAPWRASVSPTLGLRNSMPVTSTAPCIQRDIKGSKTFGSGKLEIDFKKIDGKAPGDFAGEDGKITFTPSKTAPESKSIRFVQIARTTDRSAAKEKEYQWTGGESPRNKMRTADNAKKNITGGFYVDQIAASLAKRTKKADPAVLPYYDVTGPADPKNKIGKRVGKTIQPAVLADRPGGPPPGRFLLVTSAKAADTGTWYGTVLWGFELYRDKKGVDKIKGEYKSFRSIQGQTTDEAIRKFDEYYRNPGTGKAPTK